MLLYIGKRLLQSLFVIIVVIFVAFVLVRLAPGSPAVLLLPDTATEADIIAMEERMGLNKPILEQFGIYVQGLLHGDFGTSTQYHQPVLRVIAKALPKTALLAFSTVAVVALIAIPMGIFAGAQRGKGIEAFTMGFAMLGQSMSNMWLGVLLIYIFAVHLKWLPALGTGGLKYLILPVITMAFPASAGIIRIARSGMADTLGEDYIIATYAKGVSNVKVYLKYALRNALIPVVTMLGMDLGTLLCGAIVVEVVFSWSGVGQLMSQSIGNKDYAMIQAMLMISAFIFTSINFIVDIINSLIDPRLTLN